MFLLLTNKNFKRSRAPFSPLIQDKIFSNLKPLHHNLIFSLNHKFLRIQIKNLILNFPCLAVIQNHQVQHLVVFKQHKPQHLIFLQNLILKLAILLFLEICSRLLRQICSQTQLLKLQNLCLWMFKLQLKVVFLEISYLRIKKKLGASLSSLMV